MTIGMAISSGAADPLSLHTSPAAFSISKTDGDDFWPALPW
jgi:hypothetical protein